MQLRWSIALFDYYCLFKRRDIIADVVISKIKKLQFLQK